MDGPKRQKVDGPQTESGRSKKSKMDSLNRLEVDGQSMKVDGPNRIKEKGDSQIKVRVTTQRQTSTWMGLYVQGGLPLGYMG